MRAPQIGASVYKLDFTDLDRLKDAFSRGNTIDFESATGFTAQVAKLENKVPH